MLIKRPPALTAVIGVAAAVLSLMLSSPCSALTAKDITDKMSKDERYGYLSGLIEMRAMVAAQSGDSQLPKCIHDTFYRNTGGDSDGWAKIYDAFAQFSDKEASMIVFLIIKKTCGG